MLLDTHVVLWLLDDSPRLGEGTRADLRAAPALHVSAATLWEVAIKSELGKLTVPADLPDRIHAAGLQWLDVRPEHAWASRAIEGLPHRDPFDRMLVGQAAHAGLPFVTADHAILGAQLTPAIQLRDARR